MNQPIIIILLTLLRMLFLLPLKDQRETGHTFPWATAVIVVINIVIHTWLTLTLHRHADAQTIWSTLYPFMEVPRLTLDGEGTGALSSLTSTYLHAGIGHLLGNMFILWFFGRKVEDVTGSARFALLYTLCGFTSSLLSVCVQATISSGRIPGLGASGAIAGIMGAYLFLYSDEKVLTLVATGVPLGGDCLIPILLPLKLPAWVFIIYSFMSDALWGELALQISRAGGFLPLGVGVFAHLGGAVGGMLFIYLFMHPEVFAGRR